MQAWYRTVCRYRRVRQGGHPGRQRWWLARPGRWRLLTAPTPGATVSALLYQSTRHCTGTSVNATPNMPCFSPANHRGHVAGDALVASTVDQSPSISCSPKGPIDEWKLQERQQCRPT
nr:hypothetical protein CFP56_20532 [Quercus suber]